jgi:hypothetical protein
MTDAQDLLQALSEIRTLLSGGAVNQLLMAIALGQISITFFSTVILLTEWNLSVMLARTQGNTHKTLRQFMHVPGFFFFGSAITLNTAVLTGGLPVFPVLLSVLLLASVLLAVAHLHCLYWNAVRSP